MVRAQGTGSPSAATVVGSRARHARRACHRLSGKALTLLLLCACGPGPDDLFVLAGSTLSPTLAPIDGVPLSVTRDFEGTCGNGTVLHHTTSADGGLFAFDLIRIEVIPLYRDGVVCVRAQADFESGTRVWNDLLGFPPDLVLPGMNDWSPGFTLAADGTPAFSPVLPAGTPLEACETTTLAAREDVFHGLVVTADSGVLWEESERVLRPNPDGGFGSSSESVAVALEPEELEDAQALVQLEAKRVGCLEPVAGFAPGIRLPYQVTTHWAGPSRVRRDGARVPVSRGAACAELPVPCPLTDGRLVPYAFEAPRDEVVFTLPRSAAIRTLVFRGGVVGFEGGEGPFEPRTLTVSAGGETRTVMLETTPLAMHDAVLVKSGGFQFGARPLFQKVVLPVALPASSTVTLTFNRTLLQLAEVSLFE